MFSERLFDDEPLAEDTEDDSVNKPFTVRLVPNLEDLTEGEQLEIPQLDSGFYKLRVMNGEEQHYHTNRVAREGIFHDLKAVGYVEGGNLVAYVEQRPQKDRRQGELF